MNAPDSHRPDQSQDTVRAAPDDGWILEVRHLAKAFPGVQALADVALEVERAKVHALMGENGAGKSTLMKVLTGFYAPDQGEMLFRGQAVRLKSPHDALRLGIAMIHQELMPFPNLSVAENIFMGQEPASRILGWIDRRTMEQEARRLLRTLGAHLDPAQMMQRLSVAQMQTVEIAKALAHEAAVIIMDEPTSALSDREARALFEVIRSLKTRGVAVIFISHKLDEVFQLADTVTVLRDGHHIGTRPIAELDPPQLIALMVGRDLRATAPLPCADQGEVVLAVQGLTRQDEFREVHFEVRRGEILGVAGLMGAGRTELLNAIYGLTPADAGEIFVNGQRVRIESPRDAIRWGIALVSEDRKELGLVLNLPVKHNITLASLRRWCRGWFIDRAAECRTADEQMRRFGIKPFDRNRLVNFLSGGNQQKVVLAKALLTEPAVLLLDEPTRGIDIGAKADIYGVISELARQGKTIVMVSSELPEILALSHRVMVMRQGEVSAVLDAKTTTQEEILKHAMPN